MFADNPQQRGIWIENGTKGLYQPQFTIFVAKNCTDMRDKVEIDVDTTYKLSYTPEQMSELQQLARLKATQEAQALSRSEDE